MVAAMKKRSTPMDVLTCAAWSLRCMSHEPIREPMIEAAAVHASSERSMVATEAWPRNP